METAVRKIHFCAGHRVLNHESKCANAHGHNYVMWIHARPKLELDDLGRVIDFSVLKEKANGWVDEHWDHTFILNKDDEELLAVKNTLTVNKPVYILPYNPTAENMAKYFLREICPKIFSGTDVEIHKIVLWETENCYVEATLD